MLCGRCLVQLKLTKLLFSIFTVIVVIDGFWVIVGAEAFSVAFCERYCKDGFADSLLTSVEYRESKAL